MGCIGKFGNYWDRNFGIQEVSIYNKMEIRH